MTPQSREAIALGARLGRFEVVSLLGAGGMGEVYRARDLRLGRDVALKVLPAEVASDPDRLRRFEHEARAAAALNHPNILALHDVGEHQGTPYLVTELLEGESLRERVVRGPLPVKEAVRIAIQVARGLAAAHGKGIVHRDLKPENLFVTCDGTVKILDFGLASLRGGAEGEPPSTESPTETNVTRAGTVLGTPAYMAPEQVRGQKVDQRADIFAFGCVLYEMLSGRRAFSGDTPADTLGAILKDEPARVETLASEITQPLAELVRRCLEKRPEDRFSSAHDLALALALAAATDVDPGAARAVAAAHPRPRRTAALAVAAAIAVALAITAVMLRPGGSGSDPAVALDPARVMVAPFENLTADPSLDYVAAQAADAITQGLTEAGDSEVVPAPRDLSPDDDNAFCAAARQAGSGVLARGSLYLVGDTLELRGRVLDSATGEPVYVFEPEQGPRAKPEEAIDRVRQRVMSAVLMHQGMWFLGGVTRPPLYSALTEWRTCAGLVTRDWRGAVTHCERAIELDPDFWTAYPFLWFSYKRLGEDDKAASLLARFRACQDRICAADSLNMGWTEATWEGRPLEALRQARALLALSPRDTGYIWYAVASAVGSNRPREALQALGDITSLNWDDIRTTVQGWELIRLAARAHHLLGEHEAELDLLRFGLDIYPDSLPLRAFEVRALAALGRVAEIEHVIGQAFLIHTETDVPVDVIINAAIELRVHGYSDDARRVAAQAVTWFEGHTEAESDALRSVLDRVFCLWLADRRQDSLVLARETYQAHPDDPDAQAAWGLAAARAGDRESAEAMDRALAGGAGHPRDVCLLRAGIAAQLGARDRAVELVREALARGITYYTLHLATELEPLRGYPPFEELLTPKG